MNENLVCKSIEDEFRSTLAREGYVVLADLFRPEEVRELHDAVCALFERLLPAEGSNGRDLIARTYGTDRESWQASARQMHNLFEVFRLSSSDRVREALRAAGLRAPAMCLHPELRVDVPQDAQYVQPWHQDWRSGQGSFNSLTIWLPLHDVTRNDGAIELIPASHLWGLTECEELSNPRRFVCKDTRLGESEGLFAELRVGECLLFSQMLVHRSGSNGGNLARLTAQLRYADLEEEKFRENKYRVPIGSEMVWPVAPSADAMRRIYSMPS